MYRDLRSFLNGLEQEGQLVHYTPQVLPEPDIRAILRAAADLGRRAGGDDPRHQGLAEEGGRQRPRFLGQPRPHAGHAQDGHSQGAVLRVGAALGLYPGELTWIDQAPARRSFGEGFNLLELLPLFA